MAVHHIKNTEFEIRKKIFKDLCNIYTHELFENIIDD